MPKVQTHKGRVNMESLLLDKIDQPSDLKKLNAQQVEKLCAEIRHFLLENISKTGGHLASNLGTVELTVALHRVLETPKDKIVFDVGHQCYTHKLLTGRRKQFDHLRQLDGISGFPNPHESVHDAFIAGHGNTALSLAIGMAWAKKIKHEPGLVVAVIGDGAFTGGMVYEGMNNIGGLDNLLVILNDNKMSISKNVGALARYLTHLRTTTAYYDAKDNVRSFLDGVPLIGTPMKKSLIGAKTLVRRAMYHSTMFEDMGFEYIGPVDGHNVEELERTLRSIYQRPGPHFLHIVTKKGKGYQPAEMNPGNYHGVSAFDQKLNIKINVSGNTVPLSGLNCTLSGISTARYLASRERTGTASATASFAKKADNVWTAGLYVFGFSPAAENILAVEVLMKEEDSVFNERQSVDLTPYLRGFDGDEISLELDLHIGRELEIGGPVIIPDWEDTPETEFP